MQSQGGSLLGGLPEVLRELSPVSSVKDSSLSSPRCLLRLIVLPHAVVDSEKGNDREDSESDQSRSDDASDDSATEEGNNYFEHDVTP
jgi:hypothetical protein